MMIVEIQLEELLDLLRAKTSINDAIQTVACAVFDTKKEDATGDELDAMCQEISSMADMSKQESIALIKKDFQQLKR